MLKSKALWFYHDQQCVEGWMQHLTCCAWVWLVEQKHGKVYILQTPPPSSTHPPSQRKGGKKLHSNPCYSTASCYSQPLRTKHVTEQIPYNTKLIWNVCFSAQHVCHTFRTLCGRLLGTLDYIQSRTLCTQVCVSTTFLEGKWKGKGVPNSVSKTN